MKLFLNVLLCVLTLRILPACAQNAAAPNAAATPWTVIVAPDNSFNFTFYKEMKPVASLGSGGWGRTGAGAVSVRQSARRARN